MKDLSNRYDSQKDFTSLHAWKKARLIKLFFYSEVVPLLPVEEKFNLNLQIRKASISGTANIAEGYGFIPYFYTLYHTLIPYTFIPLYLIPYTL